MSAPKYLFTLFFMLSLVCLAQTSTTSRVVIQSGLVSQRQLDGAVAHLQGVIEKFDSGKLRLVEAGTWENQVLEAAKRAAGQSLHISLTKLGRPGIYTIITAEGDTLVARWNGAGAGRPETSIWLWDTPFQTTFVMEVNPDILQPVAFTHYCDGLFDWEQFMGLKSLKISYLKQEDGTLVVTGLGDYKQTALGNYSMHFAAISTKTNGYVEVGMSKPLFEDKYPWEAYQIRERFPPLRLRIGNTPKEGLFDELGKGYIAPQLLTYPTNRDAIIVGELLSRGPLNDADLQRILIGTFDKGDYPSALILNARLIAFLRAVEKRGEFATYASVLQRVMLGATIHPSGDFVIGRLLSGLEEHHIDSSPAALSLLERNQFTHTGLFFLKRNVRDADTVRKMSELRVRPELEQEKAEAVQSIKERLSVQAKPQ